MLRKHFKRVDKDTFKIRKGVFLKFNRNELLIYEEEEGWGDQPMVDKYKEIIDYLKDAQLDLENAEDSIKDMIKKIDAYLDENLDEEQFDEREFLESRLEHIEEIVEEIEDIIIDLQSCLLYTSDAADE